MLLGVIADDFTGASDIANTLAQGLPNEGGLRTVQFLGVPEAGIAEDAQAGVIALKSRAVEPEIAVQQSLQALAWLRARGCEQIVFKYCSTFDSTRRGNIGPVGEALAAALGARGIVACPAFPKSGRTVYQGHLFVHDRLLSESGLQDHPLNPMTDPNIRRWLGYQCRKRVGLVALSTVRRGVDAVQAALAAAAERDEALAIVDAISDEDLNIIGAACAGMPLVTGGSGIARALPRNFIASSRTIGGCSASYAITGPEAILAGSCSLATREQIAVHASQHPSLQIDVQEVMRHAVMPEHIAAFVLDRAGQAPLVYTSSEPERVRALQEQYGRERLSQALDSLFGALARVLVERGVRRLVVAGGETSGAVVTALALGALQIGPEIDPGVPILYSPGADGIALALKSGNFGSAAFFAKALQRMTATGMEQNSHE
jgi:uncharacterized protein YgbK (DUF1537 family)